MAARETAFGCLSSLPDGELALLLSDVFEQRRKERRFENGDFELEDVLGVAVYSFGRFEGTLDAHATVELFAPPRDQSERENAACSALTENGVCPQCNTALISFSKVVICPVCKRTVGLT